MTTQEYISYAWENLWFLRPEWFWAFVPIGMIAILFFFSYRSKEQWKKSFPKHLLSVLIIPGTKRQFILPKIFLILLMSLMTLGMAGPTWEKVDSPGNKTEAALILILDLSRSMLAEDIQPNRIERAKLKIKDLFKAQPGTRTALIAFAGTAHTVVPFTKDYRTIERQMDALRPSIMPTRGSNIEMAFDLADSLLSKVVAPSTILLVTDNVKTEQVDRIRRAASETHIEIMTIATPNGAVIPIGKRVLKDKEGNTVTPRLDLINLKVLGQIENVNIVTVTLDDSDVQILANHIRQNLEYVIDMEQAEEEWIDAGYWLVFPVLLISLLWFRRGWMAHWCWILVLLSSCSNENDFRMADLFYTKDQQAAKMYGKGEKEKAAENFESKAWKGYTYFELDSLDQAMAAFSEDVSAEGFYNQGVVYTKMGDLEAAQQAFNTALELNPDLDIAHQNLEVVTAVIDSIKIAQGLPLEQSLNSKNNPKDFQEYTETQGEKDVAQKSDKKYEGKGDIQEMVSKEVDETTIDIFEFDQNAAISQEDAQQTLLRQVTEDPSLFLRRKFAYQNKNRKEKVKLPAEPW